VITRPIQGVLSDTVIELDALDGLSPLFVVDEDGRPGMAEVINALQIISGLRPNP